MDGDARGKPVADFETALTKDDKLELRVWLRLLSCANRIERSVRQGLRSDFDITLPRFDLLSQLDRTPGGLTMGELSRRLMVTNGNVTGMIDRLVSEGLVERRPSPSDRRAQMVTLTEAGRAAFAEMIPIHQGLVEQQMSGVSRADMRALHALLGKLKDSFKEPEAGSGATGPAATLPGATRPDATGAGGTPRDETPPGGAPTTGGQRAGDKNREGQK